MLPDMYKHPSSYRDPSGFVFYHKKTLYRQVNKCYQPDYDLLMNSGLYRSLVDQDLLIEHKEIARNFTVQDNWYKTLEPQQLDFIAYPYEWCFGMWKEAALRTLQIARIAIDHGMILKDASAYNFQWNQGKMIFIDTLSFERYNERQPWIAYRQFCEHFLAPLALMHYKKIPTQPFFLAYPDGIPLAVAKKLLPFKSKWNLHVYLNLHLQANVQNRKSVQPTTAPFSRKKLLRILDSLEAAVKGFEFDNPTGVWSGYYDEASGRNNYLPAKKAIIHDWLKKEKFLSAIDLGANEGTFSLMAAAENIPVISADADHFSVNNLFKKIGQEQIENIHPLLLNLVHPSPAIGVNNQERASLLNRVNTDLVLALALIHHIAIGHNIPFEDIAKLFQQCGDWLIVEFVPKEDEKVQVMLRQKKDIYDWYQQQVFEKVFSATYQIIEKQVVGDSGRTLYLMKSKKNEATIPA